MLGFKVGMLFISLTGILTKLSLFPLQRCHSYFIHYLKVGIKSGYLSNYCKTTVFVMDLYIKVEGEQNAFIFLIIGPGSEIFPFRQMAQIGAFYL